MKALALIRLGRQDEALASLHEVHVEDPTDDPTLQAMTICYRELHKRMAYILLFSYIFLWMQILICV